MPEEPNVTWVTDPEAQTAMETLIAIARLMIGDTPIEEAEEEIEEDEDFQEEAIQRAIDRYGEQVDTPLGDIDPTDAMWIVHAYQKLTELRQPPRRYDLKSFEGDGLKRLAMLFDNLDDVRSHALEPEGQYGMERIGHYVRNDGTVFVGFTSDDSLARMAYVCAILDVGGFFILNEEQQVCYIVA